MFQKGVDLPKTYYKRGDNSINTTMIKLCFGWYFFSQTNPAFKQTHIFVIHFGTIHPFAPSDLRC